MTAGPDDGKVTLFGRSLDRSRLVRAARLAAAIVLCAPVVWQLLLLLQLWWNRFDYPWDIEWLESSSLYHAERLMQGYAPYRPPAAGYLPPFHPPLYFVALAGAGRVLGLDYGMARTLSLVLFILGMVIVARTVGRHDQRAGGGFTTAALAIGCAAAAVPLCAGVFDLVRGDTLSWTLCLAAAAFAIDRRPTPRALGILAVLLTAALYTRLLTVFVSAWIAVFLWARNRRAGAQLAVVTTALCGLVLVGLQYGSKGWYWIYTVACLQGHGVRPDRFVEGMQEILAFAPFLPGVAALAIVLAARRKLSAEATLWLGMLAAAIPAALLPYAKEGGFANDFVPVAVMVGPATMLVVVDTVRALRRWPRAATLARYLLCSAVALLLALRHYDIEELLPKARTRKAAQDLNQLVAGLEGGVLVPRHPFLPVRNGHATKQVSDMPYLDAWWGGIPGLKLGNYLDRIDARWALVSGTESPLMAAAMADRYQWEETLGWPPAMIVGERSRIRHVLRWREDVEDPRVVFDFEEGDLSGWTLTGDAFGASPTVAQPEWQNAVTGVVGERMLNSYHPRLEDGATGRLASPPFVIDRRYLAFRIGGGKKCRVELRVGGRQIQWTAPIFVEREALLKVVWDVQRYRGQEAVLAIVDQGRDNFEHILCDHVVLYDR
ncbi:MAG: hypothetical protein JRI68_03830 [Deltaproteobacteria bacterium]|nr:hypothetical protein [Deltaproteobacteria bacterium]